MILEPAVRERWRVSTELVEAIPLERFTTGPSSDLTQPYATLETVKSSPALKTNRGDLREEITFRIHLWGDDFDQMRSLLQWLETYFSSKTICHPITWQMARVQRLHSNQIQHDDGIWQMTATFLAKANILPNVVPAI